MIFKHIFKHLQSDWFCSKLGDVLMILTVSHICEQLKTFSMQDVNSFEQRLQTN